MDRLLLLLCMSLSFSTSLAAGSDKELDIALTLADILRSSRVEIASQQANINNPDIGDKGLGGEVVVNNILGRLKDSTGFDLSEFTESSIEYRLINTQLESIREIADENQQLINRKGVGFKGFVPAVFAQLVNERFGEKVGDLATIKVTAPLHLVRNRKARPDEWERSVLDNQFSDPSWEAGNLYSETTKAAEGEAFRVMVPEYYREACLSCHGAPKGELDVTGYPKEGGALGELGGAISISLHR